MGTLYEITNEQRLLINEIEMSEGVLTEQQEQDLIINKQELEHKSMAYLSVISKKEGFNTLIDNEIKRLQQLKRVNGNVITKLKDTLLHAVKTFGDFEIGTHRFGTRKSSRIEVEDVNGLPKEFKVVKVTESADKTALKKAIQSGQQIDGVELLEIKNLKIT